MTDSKSLLVTGGSGFLGLHLCRALAKKYDSIKIADIAPIDKSEYPANVEYYNVDIRGKEGLSALITQGQDVIHAAAALPLWSKKDILETNINGTKNLLELAYENNVRRFVLVSSTAVYGVPEKHPIYEDDELVGVGAYGESKIAAEKLCEEYRDKGMVISVVRPKTFIGPERLGVFQILYDWVECGKHIPIIGKGNNRYQLLAVEDLVNYIGLMLDASSDKVNDVFNVGAECFGSVREDLGLLCDFATTGAKILPVPAILVKFLLSLFELLRISPLYKWVYMTADKDSYVSIDKARNVLGWNPSYSNIQALKSSYQWYTNNKENLGKCGVDHRVPWAQGILGLLKKIL